MLSVKLVNKEKKIISENLVSNMNLCEMYRFSSILKRANLSNDIILKKSEK